MKRILAICILVALLLMPFAALAAGPAELAVGVRGDDALRAQLRLSDLGYLQAPATGVWRAADAAALAAYAEAGGAPDLLFEQDAPRAAAGEEAQTPAAIVFGGAMPWSEAKTRLVEGKSYALTDCSTGIIVRLTYIGGEHHASMRPELTWDSATMAGLFSGASPLDARPVVLSIDGMRAAASLRLSPLAEEGSPVLAQLYFKDSGSNFSGLPDADHAAAVQAATVQN